MEFSKVWKKYYLAKNKSEFQKYIKLLGYPEKPVCFKPSILTQTGGGRGFRILRKKNLLSDIILNQKPDSKEIDFGTAVRIFDDNKKHELLVMEFFTDRYGRFTPDAIGRAIAPAILGLISKSFGFPFFDNLNWIFTL